MGPYRDTEGANELVTRLEAAHACLEAACTGAMFVFVRSAKYDRNTNGPILGDIARNVSEARDHLAAAARLGGGGSIRVSRIYDLVLMLPFGKHVAVRGWRGVQGRISRRVEQLKAA